MDTLTKLDLIRERVNVSYEKAYNALEEAGGDVIKALISLEQGQENYDFDQVDQEQFTEQFKVRGQELLEKVRQLIREGNVKKIAVKNEERTLLEIPVTAGIVSLVIFPYLTVLAGMAALYKEYRLEIERSEESPMGNYENNV